MIAGSVYVKIAAVLICIAAVAATGVWVYQSGRDNALDDVEDQNDEAGNAAIEGADSWRVCIDAGGVWDFGSGECLRAGNGGR